MNRLHSCLALFAFLITLSLSSPAFGACSAPANSIEAENCVAGTPQSQWDISGASDSTIRDLIFGADTVAITTKAAGSGFTSRITTSPDGDIAEDRGVTVTGIYSATARLSFSGPWVMQMVTFE
ncbi:MAG: hypothetical protein DMG97_18045 [Acidobacteria bacterium]|nr:MAG: hypothetical protein DMG97_18045 [Acidobacteriota bacterium]